MSTPTRKKIAVTGASGFLGSHLTRRLIKDGHEVTVLVRDAAKLKQLKLEPAHVIVGDIRDPEAFAKLTAGADVVYHLVSNFRTASDAPSAYWAINVEGTRLTVQAAERAGVKRFIYGSTIGVHGDVQQSPATETAPFNPGDLYQETKLAAEQLVRDRIGQSAMEIVVIRPCSLYGPGDLRMLKMFRMLAARKFMMLGKCDANFHAAFIDDVIEGFVLAMNSANAPGEVFFIGGPGYLPLRDYIFAAARAVGAPKPWLRLPYAPFYAAAALCEALCVPFGIEPPLHRRRVRFFRNNRAFSLAKAEKMLGYRPKVSLEEGMARTVAWYREQGLLPQASGLARSQSATP